MVIPGVSLDCLNKTVGAHPDFRSRLCVYVVRQCVFLCYACVCVCIYLARVCCLCFPFCFVSENVGETSVFNQGPGNCLVVVTTVATVLLIGLIGNYLSEPSMTWGQRRLVPGRSQREQQQESAPPSPCVPKKETEAWL